jgi:hypothetical protein
MSDKSEMYDRLKHLFETESVTLPDVIMSPRWRDTMDKRAIFGIDMGGKSPDQVFGMNVHYSNYVEDGTAYVVPRTQTTWTDNFSFEDIAETAEIHLRITEHMRALFDKNITMGIFTTVQGNNWQQRPLEGVIEWGNRLAKEGYLDNPDIRWQYQKEILALVFGAPFRAVQAVWVKVRS